MYAQYIEENLRASPACDGYKISNKRAQYYRKEIAANNLLQILSANRHFFAYYRRSSVSEFFCPAGEPPETYGQQLATQIGRITRRQTKRLQGDGNLCGVYVLIYLHLRARGHPMHLLEELLTDNLKTNDDIVYIVAELLNISQHVQKPHNFTRSQLVYEKAIAINHKLLFYTPQTLVKLGAPSRAARN